MFRPADRVVVDGLGSRPDLNKREGVVVKVMGTVRDDGRCGVLVDGEAEALAIKMSKLRFVVPDTSALTDHRCFGCERTEAEGETFSLCPICSDLNLPKSGAYFCGEECQALHWKRHTMSHKGAKAGRTLLSELRPDPEHPSLAAYVSCVPFVIEHPILHTRTQASRTKRRLQLPHGHTYQVTIARPRSFS